VPYAALAHVKARAGFLAEAWGEATDVSDADIAIFIQGIADEIDAAISGLGYDVPEADSLSAKALVGLNADGALLLALDATFPAGEGPAAATELQKAVRARYNLAWLALLGGTHPATTVVVGTGAVAGTESDFWANNPDYGRPGYSSPADPAYPSQYLDPVVGRGDPL
jgi:hypothetical protein